MKYIKQFEKFENFENDIIKKFANYVITSANLKPLNDGFMLYSILDPSFWSKNDKDYSKIYTYYFKFDTESFGDYTIGTNKLIDFLKNIDAKNIKGKNTHSKYNETDYYEVSFDIEKEKAKVSEANKYNL
jgi:hypothetical protein